ncbi:MULTISPECIES: hypothetical protein [unclassified Phaeobacter]|uniref:hypothetical protein n=1 Tax=unclassified Phaeobacter TaxID=2621772 RepID=UPI003A866D66
MLPTHAMQRALERCPGVCPGVLLRGLHYAILEQDEAVARFVGTIRGDQFLSIYFFQLPDGRTRYALGVTPTGFVVTILKPGGEVWTTQGKRILGQTGLEALPRRNERNER